MADVNTADRYVDPVLGDTNGTLLMRACEADEFEFARFLLECGADIELSKHNGAGALFQSAQNGRSRCLQLLIGARPTSRSPFWVVPRWA